MIIGLTVGNSGFGVQELGLRGLLNWNSLSHSPSHELSYEALL